MGRIEHHRKAGRRLADSRRGVVSRRHLGRAALRAITGKGQAKGKLGPGDPPTYYTYDALDNLIQVQQQGGTTDSSQWRTRTFTYNSLSQLTSASNPESGTTTYSYDADGNVVSKADARGVTTTYSYDALEKRAFFIRKIGTDGFRIGYKPTLKKVVGDRRAAQWNAAKNERASMVGSLLLPFGSFLTNQLNGLELFELVLRDTNGGQQGLRRSK